MICMLAWNKTKHIFSFYGKEITEAEYNYIKSTIDSRPTAPSGYDYRLTAELEWELYELPTVEEDEEETL